MTDTLTQLQARLAPGSAYRSERLGSLHRLQCKDGWSVSMQASVYTYCEPRNSQGPWTAVELGFPSSSDLNLLDYAEEPSDPCGTVYGWVPLEYVADVVDSHGGLKD